MDIIQPQCHYNPNFNFCNFWKGATSFLLTLILTFYLGVKVGIYQDLTRFSWDSVRIWLGGIQLGFGEDSVRWDLFGFQLCFV